VDCCGTSLWNKLDTWLLLNVLLLKMPFVINVDVPCVMPVETRLLVVLEVVGILLLLRLLPVILLLLRLLPVILLLQRLLLYPALHLLRLPRLFPIHRPIRAWNSMQSVPQLHVVLDLCASTWQALPFVIMMIVVNVTCAPEVEPTTKPQSKMSLYLEKQTRTCNCYCYYIITIMKQANIKFCSDKTCLFLV
jgi:hypothetical protein